MIKNGFARKDGKQHRTTDDDDDDDYQNTEFRYLYTNNDLLRICKTTSITEYITTLQERYVAHIARRSNLDKSKQLLFNVDRSTKKGRPTETLEQKVLKELNMTADEFYKQALKGTL